MAMDPMITALLKPEAYDHPVERIELIETHISWVLLTGPYAYKVKKPVDLGFVDFSTPQRRRWYCEEELRLNRRLAPHLYIGLSTIHGPAEHARFHGSGDPIEVAVRMHQFPQQAMLPEVLDHDGISDDQLHDLATTLATFHHNAAVAPAAECFGEPNTVGAPAMANLDVLAGRSPGVVGSLTELRHWTVSEHDRLRATLTHRKVSGRIRECHGDLHLGNMALHQGRIEVFDCLEFSPSLRWIDVISDIAFLGMDLQQRGRPDLAARLLNRWLELSGDYPGMVTWRWYLVYRALVRAKVTALRLDQPGLSSTQGEALSRQLAAYLDVARASIRPCSPALVITHGVSGSGKSHLAHRLCDALGWIQLRSDVERKRLFGLWGSAPAERLQGDPYRSEVTEVLFKERLPECVEAILASGFSLLVDATFLASWQRRLMRDLAQRLGARFLILDCPISPALALRRIQQRHSEATDPSDADGAVLSRQLIEREPLSQEEASAALVVVGEDGTPPSTPAVAAALSEALTALPCPTPGNENQGA